MVSLMCTRFASLMMKRPTLATSGGGVAVVAAVGRSANVQPCSGLKTSAFALIKVTDTLGAEPTKAKKRHDPQVALAREKRKLKKLEREVKRLEKYGRKLKPVEETEPDRLVLKEAKQRQRASLDAKKKEASESEEVFFLKREWNRHQTQQHLIQMDQIQRAFRSQNKALDELKKDNPQLYTKAIQLDHTMLPFVRDGPVRTPANKDYEPPEGDYYDVTNLFDKRLTTAS